MQPLIMDRVHLVKMLSMAEFYDAVPAFEYLRDTALTSWAMFLSSKKCTKCFHEFEYMRGVCDAFLLELKQRIADEDTETIQQIKDWLGNKKRRSISQCVIYYRRSSRGKIAKLQF